MGSKRENLRGRGDRGAIRDGRGPCPVSAHRVEDRAGRRRAARTLGAGEDPLGLSARSRVRTRSGRWLLLYGTPLSGAVHGGDVRVALHRSGPPQVHLRQDRRSHQGRARGPDLSSSTTSPVGSATPTLPRVGWPCTTRSPAAASCLFVWGVLVVLRCQAPGGMLVVGGGPALGARLHHDFGAALQRTRLLEAPVPTLLHLCSSSDDADERAKCTAGHRPGGRARRPGVIPTRLAPWATSSTWRP